MSIIIIYVSGTISYAQNFQQFSTKIIAKLSGSVEEYGLKYEFSYSENGDNICAEIFHELFPASEGMYTTIYKDSNQYTIQYYTDKVRGCIQYFNEPERKVIVNINENKTLDQLEQLKIRADKIVYTKNSAAMRYIYIKSKIDSKDISQTKELVETILKKSGASNIKSSDISGGYSITAFTGMGTPMKVGKELIDINCAICNYNSGNYVIIGMPVISTSY